MHSGLGPYLQELRRSGALTSTAVAEAVGITQSYVSKIERGLVGAIDQKVLAKLLTVLRGEEQGERTLRVIVAALELREFLETGPVPFGTERYKEATVLCDRLYAHSQRFISFSPHHMPPLWPGPTGLDDNLPMEWGPPHFENTKVLKSPREWMFGPTGHGAIDHYMGWRQPYSSWITSKEILTELTTVKDYYVSWCRRLWKLGRFKSWAAKTPEDAYLTGHYLNFDATVTLVHNGYSVDVTVDPALTARLVRIDEEATALGTENLPTYEGPPPTKGDPAGQQFSGVLARVWRQVFS